MYNKMVHPHVLSQHTSVMIFCSSRSQQNICFPTHPALLQEVPTPNPPQGSAIGSTGSARFVSICFQRPVELASRTSPSRKKIKNPRAEGWPGTIRVPGPEGVDDKTDPTIRKMARAIARARAPKACEPEKRTASSTDNGEQMACARK